MAHDDGSPERPAPDDSISYWHTTGRSRREPTFRGRAAADVVIVGGGFTGLWTAIRLTETAPDLRVVVLEQAYVGFGASGRNGGFCEASLTHGWANAVRQFPDEATLLEAEGLRNLAELVAFTRDQAIDCELEATGVLEVAGRPSQVEGFRATAEADRARGSTSRFLDRAELQAEVHSPLWLAGLERGPEHNVNLNPAKLAWGLKRVALERGIRIHEGTRVTALERRAGGVRVRTTAWSADRDEPMPLERRLGMSAPFPAGAFAGAFDGRRSAAGPTGSPTVGSADTPADPDAGVVEAGQVVIATSAYSGWYPRLGGLFVPVYDYVLVSDPLTTDQAEAIGWRRRQGMADADNQFHYFRRTADDRILWGGYDAVYHAGNGVGPRYDRRPATFEKLEAHFLAAFPQLTGIGFPFRWGGAIDTTSRFTVTFGRALGDRVVYALGYTGLGVGASRWAAGVVRDFILCPGSDLLRLRFVRSRPLAFPPEPFRSLVVNVVRHELDRADREDGRRGLILRTLDALGIGFDS